MKVRAHHEINLFGPHACGRKPLEIRHVEHVPERPAGFYLVIAATRIDKDFLAAHPQQPAVDREYDLAGRSLVMMRGQPAFVLREQSICEVRKDVAEKIARKICLFDTRDGGLANFKQLLSPRTVRPICEAA